MMPYDLDTATDMVILFCTVCSYEMIILGIV